MGGLRCPWGKALSSGWSGSSTQDAGSGLEDLAKELPETNYGEVGWGAFSIPPSPHRAGGNDVSR